MGKRSWSKRSPIPSKQKIAGTESVIRGEQQGTQQVPIATSKPNRCARRFRLIVVGAFVGLDSYVHSNLVLRFPQFMATGDRALGWLLGILSHNLFGIIVAFILVVLGVAGVQWIVLISILGAWLVTFLWIARSRTVRKLTPVTRIFIVLGLGTTLALTGRSFASWALRSYRHNPSTPSKVSDKAPTQLDASSAELSTIQNLNQFLIGKQENELRQEFAIDLMFHTNVEMVRAYVTMFHRDPKGLESFDWTAFLDSYRRDGVLRAYPGIMQVARPGGGGFIVKVDPKRVAIIVIPAKYNSGRAILKSYIDSAFLPNNIRDAVRAVDGNTDLVQKTLDEALVNDPNYYLRYEDSSSKYFHSVDGTYFRKFIQLEKKAHAITEEIRKVTGTN